MLMFVLRKIRKKLREGNKVKMEKKKEEDLSYSNHVNFFNID